MAIVGEPDPERGRKEPSFMGPRTLLIIVVAVRVGTLAGIGAFASAWIALPTSGNVTARAALSGIAGLGAGFVTFLKVAKELHRLID